MLNQKHASDNFQLTVIQGGEQRNYELHKSCICLAMDVQWLSDPHGPSQASAFLDTQPYTQGAAQPHGYGAVLVSFDAKCVFSIQGYKDVGVLTLDEVGYIGAAAPTWMDWQRLVEDAFQGECINKVLYRSGGSGATLAIDLPLVTRSRKSHAMRFATSERPEGFKTVGFSFCPPGWAVRHEMAPVKGPARSQTLKRVLTNLERLCVDRAADHVWESFTLAT